MKKLCGKIWDLDAYQPCRLPIKHKNGCVFVARPDEPDTIDKLGMILDAVIINVEQARYFFKIIKKSRK